MFAIGSKSSPVCHAPWMRTKVSGISFISVISRKSKRKIARSIVRVKLEDERRADQESTRRFHQRRSSAVETPAVLRLLAYGFGFRPHRSLGCKGDRSFTPP